MAFKRIDDRKLNQLRPIKLTLGYLKFKPASCLLEWGDTKIVCSASVEEGVPPFLKGKGTGWLTGEYGMLPGSSAQRIAREASRGKQSGRTQEIQRLIGRSLRSITDTDALGERTIILDCDVLQADGGTRCAAITGAYVALMLAVRGLMEQGLISRNPVKDSVSAVSVGMVQQHAMLDLNYAEDSTAEVDMNVIMTGSGKFVEVQGTAEKNPFSGEDLEALLALARKGNRELIAMQAQALGATVKQAKRR